MSEKDIENQNTSLPSLVEPDESTSDEATDGANATMYKYRDFSTVNDEELEQQSPEPSSPPPNSSRGGVESSIRVQKFPVKLYAILAQKEFQEIITWMPHGRSWKVLKPNMFESLVMPLFFEYSNYHSFNRLVNAWSFRRISSGPDRGSYYHELFLRGKPHLQKFMRRLPKTHKKLPMKKDDEPDFYAMDKANPLPTLEEAPLPSTAMMPQIRQAQGMGGPSAAGILAPGMMGAMTGGPSAMAGMAAFEARDPLMGMMGQARGVSGHLGGGAMAMSGMAQMGAMAGMESLGAMTGLGAMGGMGMNGLGFAGMNQMNAMNGMSSLRESAGFGSAAAMGASEFELQRLRHLQQMQMMQMTANDPLGMNLRLGRQPC